MMLMMMSTHGDKRDDDDDDDNDCCYYYANVISISHTSSLPVNRSMSTPSPLEKYLKL